MNAKTLAIIFALLAAASAAVIAGDALYKHAFGPHTPLFTIPEAVILPLPGQTLVFVPEAYLNEITRNYQGRRMTNLVVYANGL